MSAKEKELEELRMKMIENRNREALRKFLTQSPYGRAKDFPRQ